MKKIILLASLLATATCNIAAAGDNYFGIDYMSGTYEEDGGIEASPTMLRGKLGTYVTPAIAVEGHVGFGVAGDTVNVMGIPVELEIDNIIGAYFRGELPIAEKLKLYGLVGFTRVELTATAFGYSVSGNETDFSYGLGGELPISDTVSILAEYAQLVDKIDFSLSSLNLGVKAKF